MKPAEMILSRPIRSGVFAPSRSDDDETELPTQIATRSVLEDFNVQEKMYRERATRHSDRVRYIND